MAYTIVHEHFKTLESLIDIMEKRPLNAVFKKKDDLSSQREYTNKGDGRPPWAGTYDYKEAEHILRAGYKEPLEKMKKAILKIGQNDNYARPKSKNDFIGFAPNVPNYLNNNPLTMINRTKITPKINTIHLIYSFCGAAHTTPEELIQGGINFISLVNSLEKQGYRVKIDAIFASISNSTAAAFSVNLKEYSQGTNLLKLSFPLVHPAMLRRFSFKWLESTPELKEKKFINGYGTPLNFRFDNDSIREKEFLKNNGIIKGENAYYCNVYTALKAVNITDLAERMEIIK